MALGKIFGQAGGRKVREDRDRTKAEVATLLHDFNSKQKGMFSREYFTRKKTLFNGYLCLFFCGCHYAYTDQWTKQALFWLTLGGCMMWWLIDLLVMSRIVERYNLDLSKELVDEVYERGYRRANKKKWNTPHYEVPASMAERVPAEARPSAH